MQPIVMLLGLLLGPAARSGPDAPAQINVQLSEWEVGLSRQTVPTGTVTFAVTNAGRIPHAFEVAGGGIENATAILQPGEIATLTVTLKAGSYELYCPVGNDSHKMLGMLTQLRVVDKGPAVSGGAAAAVGAATTARIQAIRVTGGGPVIQILPGPFPFPDSARPVLQAFGAEREGLESQVLNGPYSNSVAPISGTFTFTAWDKGATKDSVDGEAEFTTQDGAKWQLVMDRVQTKDVPHHPRFGGVIFGLYYHGITQVHTPLVPTITSAVALWSFARLYRNGARITDNAMVHVMLLSHTRRDTDFAIECWDCSRNKVDELQLQILPGPGEPKFDAPGGFLFVNWEASTSKPRG